MVCSWFRNLEPRAPRRAWDEEKARKGFCDVTARPYSKGPWTRAHKRLWKTLRLPNVDAQGRSHDCDGTLTRTVCKDLARRCRTATVAGDRPCHQGPWTECPFIYLLVRSSVEQVTTMRLHRRDIPAETLLHHSRWLSHKDGRDTRSVEGELHMRSRLPMCLWPGPLQASESLSLRLSAS